MNAKELLNTAKAHGGLTLLNGAPVNYNNGYQVASDIEFIVSTEEAGELLRLYLEGHKSIAGKEIDTAAHVGLWLDTKNNEWYLDFNGRHILDYDEAIAEAKKYKQLAIFDWATMESIYL